MFSTRTPSLSRKPPAVGMMSPATNAPKSARIPMSCVHNAAARTMPMTMARTPLVGSIRSNASLPSQAGTFGLMTKSMTATKINTRPRQQAAATVFAAFAKATTNARSPHAVTSPTAAQAVAVRPNELLNMPRSCKMRTRTGKAVILIEIAMKSAKAIKDAPGCARRS